MGKMERFRFIREKVKQPTRMDNFDSKPIKVSEKAPEAQLPNCKDCGKPLKMADIGASRDRHLFCPR